MKPYEKGNMTADMIARIVKDGRNAIDSVFTELMDKMHIQGICVYAGDDMACVKKYGKYGNHPQYAALMEMINIFPYLMRMELMLSII